EPSRLYSVLGLLLWYQHRHSARVAGAIALSLSFSIDSHGTAMMGNGTDYLRCINADCSISSERLAPGTWTNPSMSSLTFDGNDVPRMVAQQGTPNAPGTQDQLAPKVPSSLGGPTATKTVYNGTQLLDCYQRPENPPVPVFYGYQECESYTVLDQRKPPQQIVQYGIAFDEDIQVV